MKCFKKAVLFFEKRMEKQKIGTLQTHIKQRPVPQNGTADISAHRWDYLRTEPVMCIAGGHHATSLCRMDIFYTNSAALASGLQKSLHNF